MSVQKEFSKYANKYDENNIIQRIVSKALIREIQKKPQHILELGCGSGQLIKNIQWDYKTYNAVDFSQSMCNLHPKSNNTFVHCLDFDSKDFEYFLRKKKFDLVISSSSMQWSQNISQLVNLIFMVTQNFYGALFTSNTFNSIYKITKQHKQILSLEEIKNAFSSYNPTFEVIEYKLYFDTKKEMFSYIKNSGIAGDKKLSYTLAKQLYVNYPHKYLEFEIVFVKAFI